MEDFAVHKMAFFPGPNYYLDGPACVFNLYLNPDGKPVSFYEPEVIRCLPGLEARMTDRVAGLFAGAVREVLRMDIDLWVPGCAVTPEGDASVVAVSYLDRHVAEDAVFMVQDWFRALDSGETFDFQEAFASLQADFNRTVYGGPTVYSLVESGLKRRIPVHYLYEENQFQWGYGKRQVRGRSTTFHIDSIKDTEFTTYKDMVKDFLLMCGFPTPLGRNCMTADQAVEEAEDLGYPVVVKPLAGHKGQGVTTGIVSAEGVREAFQRIAGAASAAGTRFEGAIVENQVEGVDHRLLTVGGRFVAGLKRVPAYVEGDGAQRIAGLIEKENATLARLDNARSPLCKIRVDDDLNAYLALQGKSLDAVPALGERVYLRRVANISAGGVSMDVTETVHPDTIRMAEDIARFFDVTCLGIDVLAQDITRSWREGQFGIIEINAGPGVFMHTAPAIGNPVDVPGIIMDTLFPEPAHGRIPIIVGNRLTRRCADLIRKALRPHVPEREDIGVLVSEGIFFNDHFFCRNPDHDQNVKILLRNPRLAAAIVRHDQDGILDFGICHQGADVVILDSPGFAEKILRRDLLPGGLLVTVREDALTVFRDDRRIASQPLTPEADVDAAILQALAPHLPELMKRYE